MGARQGLSEPLGALIALLFVKPFLTPLLLHFMLAFVGGIMVSVSARRGYHRAAAAAGICACLLCVAPTLPLPIHGSAAHMHASESALFPYCLLFMLIMLRPHKRYLKTLEHACWHLSCVLSTRTSFPSKGHRIPAQRRAC